MATSAILDKFSTDAAFTITVVGLASSAAFVGQQSTLVDNTTTRYSLIHVFVKFTCGTSPTANKGVYLYAIRGDKDAGTAHRSDQAGATDAGWTRANAEFLGVGRCTSVTGNIVQFEAFIVNPGPEFGVGFYHDTGVIPNGTAGNHWFRWIGNNPEAQ